MAEKHVCKFRRHRFRSGSTVYFCANGCSKKVTPALALGKQCICWRCGNVFTMSDYSVRLVKPHCDNCHKPRNGVDEAFPPAASVPTMTPLQSLSDRLRMVVGGEPIDSEDDGDI